MAPVEAKRQRPTEEDPREQGGSAARGALQASAVRCRGRALDPETLKTQDPEAWTAAPIAQLVKGRLSDARGLRFESQAGRVTGKSIPGLLGEKRPAIKGLRPPEHLAGKFHPDHQKIPPSQTQPKRHGSPEAPKQAP